MSVFVVDASMVIKWFIPGIHSEAARRWLGASHDYVAPDLLFAEVGNVVWKKVRRQEMDADKGRELLVDLARVAVEAVATRTLLQDAMAVALAAGITVYDAMYLTRAVRLQTEVITGDDRLPAKLGQHPLLVPHVRRLQDFVE